MKCSASKFELELMPDHSVRMTLRCDSAYEAALLYDDIGECAKAGGVELAFETKNQREASA